MAKRTKHNRLCVEWVYAGQCWDSLKYDTPLPDVPSYTIWEVDDMGSTPDKVINHKVITPKMIRCKGKVLFES